MRAVNLIPSDQRGGRGAAGQSLTSYAVIAGLALVLLAVVSVALTSNKISDRKAEAAELRQRDATAKERLGKLGDFAAFEKVREARVQTIKGLVASRFDWDAVLRDLARAVPGDVKLTSLTGNIGGAPGSAGTTAASGVSGPSLELGGCGDGHEAVAGFIRRAERIKGVTRVGVPDSSRGASSESGETGGGCGGGRDTTFSMTIAFDGQNPPPPSVNGQPQPASGGTDAAQGATSPGTQPASNGASR